MGKLRWYKRDPVAALEGMSDLSLEERGAYNTVLDLIYARDGAVDDDDRFIAGWLRCDVRVWRRIKTRLVDLGKLYLADGSLRNSRADAEVDRGLSMVASASDAGKASARKRNGADNKNKEIASTAVETTVSTNSTTTATATEEVRKKESSLRSVARETSDWPADGFDQFWRRYPHKVGKRAALKAFAAAKRLGAPWAQVIFALERYVVEKPPDRAWCNPATWLNGGRWDDEPARASPASGAHSPSFHEIADNLRAYDENTEPGPARGEIVDASDDGGQLDFGASLRA